MQQRKLGYTDLHLTTIGFGAWAIGGPWDFGWGPQDDDESIAAIQAGLDAGINWIDTAPAYGLGHSEEVIGRALKGRRDSVILATKCGLVWNDPSERSVFNRLKAASVRAGGRGQPAPAGRGRDRPLPDPLAQPRRRRGRGVDRDRPHDRGGQDPLRGRVQLQHQPDAPRAGDPSRRFAATALQHVGPEGRRRSCCRSAPQTTSGSSSTARWHPAC